MEYVIFDQDYLEIPFQDYPVGNLAICHDPQKRLGKITWAVVKVNTPGSPPDAYGLFWDKDMAIQFAKTFA
jgi:hypothetical protein